MKKFSILLLSAILLITALAFTSCDQQAVDDALNNLMDASAEVFEPVFNKAESSTESSGTPDIEPSDDEEESEEESQTQQSTSLPSSDDEQEL